VAGRLPPSIVAVTGLPTGNPPLTVTGAQGASVLSAVTSPTPLAPERFAQESENLVDAVAALNRSELAFIQLASPSARLDAPGVLARPFIFGPGRDEMDDKLAQVAADALQVAAIADMLRVTAVSQDGGSDDAGKVSAN
jgi:hypothetical protein